jgi:hypothetical protein
MVNKKLQKKECFENSPKYGDQTFRWVTNPSDPKYNYISQSENIIYIPDPEVLTNKNLYVVNV